MVSIVFNGRGHNVPPAHKLGFVWGTVAGGPYPNDVGPDVAGTSAPNQPYGSITVGGFTPGAQYYAKAVIKDASNIVFDTSPEFAFVAPVPTTMWNIADKTASITLSNGDLTAVGTAVANAGARNVHGKSAGKLYIEYQPIVGLAGLSLGLASAAHVLTTFAGGDANSIGLSGNAVYAGNAIIGGSDPMSLSQVSSLAVDLTNKKAWFRTNGGNWNNNAANNPATNVGGFDIAFLGSTVFLTLGTTQANNGITLNSGGTPFAFAVPAGFLAGWPQ